MKRIIFLLPAFACLLLTSCGKFDSPHFIDVQELVVPSDKKLVQVPVEGGIVSSSVYSNGKVDVRVLGDCGDWASVDSPMSFEGDMDISVYFAKNKGFRRMMVLELSLNSGIRKDTICFRQAGLVPSLACGNPYAAVDGTAKSTVDFGIVTNIPAEEIALSAFYPSDSKDWISDVSWKDPATVSVSYDSNTEHKVTKAGINLSYKDGWGQDLRLNLFLTRSDNSGSFGKVLSFEEVRALATESGYKVTEEDMIEGIVISDYTSRNMALNPSVAYNSVDVSPSEKTAYIEAEDASCGFRLLFETKEDNSLAQGAKLKLNLSGTVITKETDPERYTISGLKGDNFIGGTYGNALPVKQKTVAELSDKDIYTFVTVRNMEFLDKGGCYSNVYDAYSLPADFNPNKTSVEMDCWPAMLVDNQGNPIYAIVNMLCPWRRTGDGVPDGSGNLNGILVHEDLLRYGDVGRYQIRVVDENGYGMDPESPSNFNGHALWEGRYAYDYASYGKYFPYDTPSDGVNTITPSDDFNIYVPNNVKGRLYLENKKAAPASGSLTLRPCKVYDSPTMASSGAVSNKGLSVQVKLEGWYNWKDENTVESYNGLRIETSTAGLTVPYMLFYVSFAAGGAAPCFKNFPAHWCTEYSVDGGQSYTLVKALDNDREFVHLRSYPFASASISGTQYLPCSSTGMGFTEHIFRLPAEAVGCQSLKIRFRPYDTVMTALPVMWNEPIENNNVSYYITYDNDIRFGAIKLLVPVAE